MPEGTDDSMKIRYGFVSNSSSSSFVAYGKIFSVDKFKKLCNNLSINLDFPDKEFGCYCHSQMYEVTDVFEKATDLKCRFSDGAQEFYIGKEYRKLTKDSDIKAFFEDTEKFLGKKCFYIESTIECPD